MAPHAAHLRNGTKMGDLKFVDTMIKDGLLRRLPRLPHGQHRRERRQPSGRSPATSRTQFAVASQNKAEAAQKAGRFKDEIVPVTMKGRKGDIIVDQDEYIRPGTTLDAVAKLRPAFSKDGTVTAGNASGINDGAAARRADDRRRGRASAASTPLARIASWATAGVDPAIMGTGPIPASRKALEKAGWKVDDLDLIEANEAFAAQAIAVNKDLGWDTVEGERQRRRHRHRPSDRRVRRARVRHAAARDAAPRRQEGPRHAVHRRRHGHRAHASSAELIGLSQRRAGGAGRATTGPRCGLASKPSTQHGGDAWLELQWSPAARAASARRSRGR